MITIWYVFRTTAAWTLGLLAFCVALMLTIGTIDQQSLAAALGSVPPTLMMITPLTAGLGAALASARLESLGERTVLSANGFGPWRTAWPAAVVGAVLGLGQLGLPELLSQPPGDDSWVWVGEHTAVHPSSQIVLHAQKGRITEVQEPPDPDALVLARQALHPQMAPMQSLRTQPTLAHHLALHERWARGLWSALLAFCCWMPMGRTASDQVARASGITALVLLTSGLALTWGRMGLLNLWLATWALPLGLGLGLAARWLQSR